MKEKVAVFRSSDLDVDWSQSELVIPFSDDIEKMLNRNKLFWIDKIEAETDETYKQVIPYILIQNPIQQFFCYQRRGNEKRLHGLWSLGIGGHVNEQDKEDINLDTFLSGAIREVFEETAIVIEKSDLKVKGVIYESESNVGRVHLGIVYLLNTNKEISQTLETELSLWGNGLQLASKKIELWSKLSIKLI